MFWHLFTNVFSSSSSYRGKFWPEESCISSNRQGGQVNQVWVGGSTDLLVSIFGYITDTGPCFYIACTGKIVLIELLLLVKKPLRKQKINMWFHYWKVASCTLDASAKIYAGRVDSIHAQAYKMLGGLGRAENQGKFVFEDKFVLLFSFVSKGCIIKVRIFLLK